MAITAQDIINKSMRLLGLLASGEAPTAAEAQDSLYSLNSVIDSYSANPQYYFCTLAEQFTLVNGQNTYTIGNDPDTAAAVEKMGATHQECEVSEIVEDKARKLVSTPAYMLAQSISEAASGINKMVDRVLELTQKA